MTTRRSTAAAIQLELPLPVADPRRGARSGAAAPRSGTGASRSGAGTTRSGAGRARRGTRRPGSGPGGGPISGGGEGGRRTSSAPGPHPTADEGIRLDEQTRRIGRQGIAAARALLAAGKALDPEHPGAAGADHARTGGDATGCAA